MTPQPAPPLAVSTWSIHRAIGISYPNAPENDTDTGPVPTWGPGSMGLLDVPEAVTGLGIDRIELCHFHVPGRDTAYLSEFRSALAEAGVVLQTLLIDAGDITDPVHARRDMSWIARWIEVAVVLGAERARVIAGKQPPLPDVLDRSAAGLAELAAIGESLGMRIITENWHATFSGPEEVNSVLDRLDGRVGLIADFANWKGPWKYDGLASICARAEDTHAGCAFDAALNLDADDYGRCFAAAAKAGYDGPHTLIYAGPNDDEFEALRRQRDFVRDFHARAAA